MVNTILELIIGFIEKPMVPELACSEELHEARLCNVDLEVFNPRDISNVQTNYFQSHCRYICSDLYTHLLVRVDTRVGR
jgi:hypothetical protein